MTLLGRTKAPENKERLKALVAELQARGIDIPTTLQLTKKKWPVDSNGYLTKNNGSFYEPTVSHRDFIVSTARFIGFVGSRGSGKSAAGAQKAMLKIRDGQPGAVLNPDFENFKTSTWPEFREWIPWDMIVPNQKYRAEPSWEPHQPFRLTFQNGVTVICKGVKDEDSARGPNINWLWYDEGSRDQTGLPWKISIASVRVGNNPQAWATYTPRGKQHWTYEFFEERKIPDEVIKILEEIGADPENLVESFYGTIEDNKSHLDPLFYASLLMAYSNDPLLRKQELEGKYVNPLGTLGDRNWFNGKVLDVIPEPEKDENGNITKGKIRDTVRYWDLAASEKKIAGKKLTDPDETSGTRMAWNGEVFYIEDQVNGQWAWKDIKDQILKTAIYDGPYVKIFIEEEPGAGGKNQVAEIKQFLKEKLPGVPIKVEGHRPQGDKVMRAETWFDEAKRGKIYLIKGHWNGGFLDQLDDFPDIKHDDRVDSTSGARLTVAPIISWSEIKFMKI